MNKVQVVILAAGKGKRMNADVPKVLVPFHDKPMVDYVVEAVKHSGIDTKPVLVVGYGKELVINHCGDSASYAEQTDQLGTGHAVKCSEDAILPQIEHVMVLYGDQPAITGAMISNLAKTHINSGKNLTMATVDLPGFDSWYSSFLAFGRIIRNTNNEIEKIVEYKDATDDQKEIKEVNPAYFCFKKDWLFDKLEQVKNTNSQGEYYLTDLVELAFNNGGIASVHISPEEALGVNTIDQLRELEQIIKKTD
jgi:bifunctional UDP-N-acetylglucosamine pyrophosphorylase/glucosamine-1-phosphate N-acetyltransferase